MSSLSPARSSREPIDRRIARLAARRYGVFSRVEAERFGATKAAIDWRLEIGRWERIDHGVYRLAGTPPSWHQRLVAACLSWGDGSVASHRAAGAVFALAGVPTGIIELIVPRSRWRRARGVILHRVPLAAIDRTIVAGIPVTTPARTLFDLAAVLSHEAAEEALDDALRRKLVTLSRLQRRLESVATQGRPGVALMRRLIAARGATDVPESFFETRLLRALKRCGLPQPAIQHEIRDRGMLVARVDLAYPHIKVAIEADGYRWHSSRARWRADLERRNRLTALGWRVVHVTWEDLRRSPVELLRLISFPR